MKRFLVAILAAALFGVLAFSTAAKDKTYTLNLTISSVESKKTGDTQDSGSANRGLLGGVVHHERHHDVVAKYVEAMGDDGNVYEISPNDKKLVVLPGTYKARFTNHDLIVLFPSGKEEKFQVIAVAKAEK